MKESRIKQILDEDKLAVGIGIFTGSPIVVQVIGYSGFNFVFTDMEYTPVTIDREPQALVVAANEGGMGTCVCVRYNDEVLIHTTTEFGADAVVVPHCRTAKDARKMIQAVRFPPYGVKGSATGCGSAGYGYYPDFNFGEYAGKCNRETLIIPLTEDPEFFGNMDEIPGVEGLGGVQLGPSDLTLSLSIKETYNSDNPQVKSRFGHLFKKAKGKGIPLIGPIAPPNLERAVEMAENGAKVMMLRNDVADFKMLLADLRKDVYIPLKEHFEAIQGG